MAGADSPVRKGVEIMRFHITPVIKHVRAWSEDPDGKCMYHYVAVCNEDDDPIAPPSQYDRADDAEAAAISYALRLQMDWDVSDLDYSED